MHLLNFPTRCQRASSSRVLRRGNECWKLFVELCPIRCSFPASLRWTRGGPAVCDSLRGTFNIDSRCTRCDTDHALPLCRVSSPARDATTLLSFRNNSSVHGTLAERRSPSSVLINIPPDTSTQLGIISLPHLHWNVGGQVCIKYAGRATEKQRRINFHILPPVAHIVSPPQLSSGLRRVTAGPQP